MLEMLKMNTDSDLFTRQSCETLSGRPIQIYKTPIVPALQLKAGDSYTLEGRVYDKPRGLDFKKRITAVTDKAMIFDTACFFVLEQELGFESAICVAFGESKRS